MSRCRLLAVAAALVLVAGACSAAEVDDGASPPPERRTTSREPMTWVVAPGGDDEGAGTERHPWATIAHALAQLEAGDTLLVRGGVYEERIVNVDLEPGTPERQITVRAFPDETPEIRGLLWLDRPDHWTIRGLRILWDDTGGRRREHMVKITDGTGWRFEENELAGARSFAALLVASTREDEPDDWSVARNCIHSTHQANGRNQDHLIYVNSGTGAGSGRVERNLLFDAPNGNGVKLGGSAKDEGGAANVTVVRNTIWGAAQSVAVAWRSSGNEIRENLLGGTARSYSAIRAYRLSGEGNVAAGNVVADTNGVVLNDEGHVEIADEGGNIAVDDPAFDDTTSCTGFRPGDPEAAAAGHLSTGG